MRRQPKTTAERGLEIFQDRGFPAAALRLPQAHGLLADGFNSVRRCGGGCWRNKERDHFSRRCRPHTGLDGPRGYVALYYRHSRSPSFHGGNPNLVIGRPARCLERDRVCRSRPELVFAHRHHGAPAQSGDQQHTEDRFHERSAFKNSRYEGYVVKPVGLGWTPLHLKTTERPAFPRTGRQRPRMSPWHPSSVLP